MKVSGQLHVPAALPWGNRRQYQFDKKLCGPQNRFGRCGEKTNLAPAENQTPAFQPLARRYTDWDILTPDIEQLCEQT
jgi:hypothetical protein